MDLLKPLRPILKRRNAQKRKRTSQAIHDRLDVALSSAASRKVHVATDRLIIFSDQHKGARDGADDFQRCERSYNAALAYYNRMGYHLLLLGDVEELWENTFEQVASNYPVALELEAAFHTAGRYTRLFGNHDIDWSDTDLFQDKMASHNVGDVIPIEALRLVLHDAGGKEMGELFLAHGHQGTPDSDLNARRSKFFVRNVWRPLQGRLNRPWNTPSMDWQLRGQHAHDMATWANSRRKVLIAGHTHQPVFFGNHKQPAVTPDQVTAPVNESDPDHAEALLLARQQWAAAEQVRLRKQKPIDLNKPCYFNTGCCSFGDGDITGIELSGGKIRLVRWPCKPDAAEEELAVMDLEEVFEMVS